MGENARADDMDRPFVAESEGIDVEVGSIKKGTEYVEGGST